MSTIGAGDAIRPRIQLQETQNQAGGRGGECLRKIRTGRAVAGARISGMNSGVKGFDIKPQASVLSMARTGRGGGRNLPSGRAVRARPIPMRRLMADRERMLKMDFAIEGFTGTRFFRFYPYETLIDRRPLKRFGSITRQIPKEEHTKAMILKWLMRKGEES